MHTPEPGTSPVRLLKRRELMQAGALGAIGLSLGGHPRLRPACAATATSPATTSAPSGPAEAIIQIFLEGGVSHLDSFDPKPSAALEIRGEFGAVNARAEGMQLSGLWGQTASVGEHLAIIRSMTHGEAAHERAAHWMLTGRAPAPEARFPSVGSIVAHALGARRGVPAYVELPDSYGGYGFGGPGSLGASSGPFGINGNPGDDRFIAADLRPPRGVMLPSSRPASQPTTTQASRPVEDMGPVERQMYALATSEAARNAFDLKSEPDPVRATYGRTAPGTWLLAARRLVEAGTRFITVYLGGWDMHVDLHPAMRSVVPPVDQAIAALLRDLHQRGLLGTTLVLISTEFGRSPRINRDRGRDHWSKVFSVALAGGGTRGGQVIGSSSPDGAEPKDNPISPADLAATVLTRVGIDPKKKLPGPAGTSLDVLGGGTPIKQLV